VRGPWIPRSMWTLIVAPARGAFVSQSTTCPRTTKKQSVHELITNQQTPAAMAVFAQPLPSTDLTVSILRAIRGTAQTGGPAD
jgi:hypothetical protein